MQRLLIVLAAITILTVGVVVAVIEHASKQGIQSRTARQTANTASPSDNQFNKDENSISDPSSLWIVVNKQRPLNPLTFVPGDLTVPNEPLRLTSQDSEMQMRTITALALEDMFAGAKKQGINLMVASGYRSYDFQVGLYNRYVSTQGAAVADTQSAKPGYSEHQTGLAVDVEPASRQCEVQECFGKLPEGTWVAQNAYKYGFIIRYPEGKQSFTGYIYEPWHVRYVGKELAAELHRQGNPTLEEFFGTGSAPDYSH